MPHRVIFKNANTVIFRAILISSTFVLMIFVTGGTGLLGRNVLIELLRRGEKIRALKRATSDLSMVRSVFRHYLGDTAEDEFGKIEWVDGDLLDLLSLRDGMAGCNVVYHCAATVSFLKRDFRKLMKVNREGTANVVNTALELGVDHLCYVSSTASVGKKEGKELRDENDKWVRSPENSGYSISKYSAEMEVWRGIEEGLPAVIVNPGLILGAGDWNDSSVSIFKVVKKGLLFFTPGVNGFVDARDVARIMTELSEKKIFNQRFLLISENLPFRTLFDWIADAFGVKRPSVRTTSLMAGLAWRWEGLLGFLFGRKQNITRETAKSAMHISTYSNEKIKAELGYEFIPIHQSVLDAVSFFKKL